VTRANRIRQRLFHDTLSVSNAGGPGVDGIGSNNTAISVSVSVTVPSTSSSMIVTPRTAPRPSSSADASPCAEKLLYDIAKNVVSSLLSLSVILLDMWLLALSCVNVRIGEQRRLVRDGTATRIGCVQIRPCSKNVLGPVAGRERG